MTQAVNYAIWSKVIQHIVHDVHDLCFDVMEGDGIVADGFNPLQTGKNNMLATKISHSGHGV